MTKQCERCSTWISDDIEVDIRLISGSTMTMGELVFNNDNGDIVQLLISDGGSVRIQYCCPVCGEWVDV